MATIKLDFSSAPLGALQRARLPQQGAGLAQMPIGLATAPGEGLAEMGQALGRLAEAERRARAETTQNTARAAGLRALAEAEQFARGDVEAFRSRSREAFQGIAEGMDPADRAAFLSRMDPEAAGIEFRVRRTGTARIGAEAVGSLDEVLRETGARAAAAALPEERERLRAAGRERIEAAIAAGYLPPAAARDRLTRWNAEVSEGAARRLLLDSPAEAERLLRDPAQLPGLSPVQRYRLLDGAIRAQRRRGGGLRRGGGVRVSDVPEVAPSVAAALDADAERLAEAEDDAEFQVAVAGERAVFTMAQAAVADATVSWFRAAAGEADADGSALLALDDMTPSVVRDAARTVALTGGAATDDPAALDALLPAVADLPPDLFRAEAARAVADGRLTAGGWVRLAKANDAAAADTPAAAAWRQVRTDAAAQLAPPDLGDLVPGLPDLAEPRRRALLELDEWRAANPRASASQARDEARALVVRHREAMVDALAASLPPPEGFMAGSGPYASSALEAAEMDVLTALDGGAMDDAEAGRRLRLIEAWRWVAEDMGADEAAPPDPDRGGRGGRMRFR